MSQQVEKEKKKVSKKWNRGDEIRNKKKFLNL